MWDALHTIGGSEGMAGTILIIGEYKSPYSCLFHSVYDLC